MPRTRFIHSLASGLFSPASFLPIRSSSCSWVISSLTANRCSSSSCPSVIGPGGGGAGRDGLVVLPPAPAPPWAGEPARPPWLSPLIGRTVRGASYLGGATTLGAGLCTGGGATAAAADAAICGRGRGAGCGAGDCTGAGRGACEEAATGCGGAEPAGGINSSMLTYSALASSLAWASGTLCPSSYSRITREEMLAFAAN